MYFYNHMDFRASLYWYKEIHDSFMNVQNSHTIPQIWFISLNVANAVHTSPKNPCDDYVSLTGQII